MATVVTTPNFQTKARNIVLDQILEMLDKTDPKREVTLDDIFVVWFAKTLQNWKALVSTTLPDGKYYEVTYDGDKRQAYVDIYVKVRNVCVTEPMIRTDDPLREAMLRGEI